jgi:hypothetical protein
MTNEPGRRLCRYIDEETQFPHQTSGHRAKQVLPRKNYDTAELARQARHQAREEARQRSRTTNRATPDEEEEDEADIDGTATYGRLKLQREAQSGTPYHLKVCTK